MKNIKRSYVGELEWVIDQIHCANHDRNQNRQAQLDCLTKYGMLVAIARRSKEPIPERPDYLKSV
jgi:hypothetical protein